MLRLFSKTVRLPHTVNTPALAGVGVNNQVRGKKGRSKGPRKPPKSKPHKGFLPNINLAKVEEEVIEGPRKNSWAYKSNHKPAAYGWTPGPNATKKYLAEKNKEMNPPGTAKPFVISERNQQLIQQIHDAANSSPTDPKLAIEAYHRMNASPNTQIYNSLLKAFAGHKGYLGEAVQIYNDMKKQNLVPAIETYLLLLECCQQESHLPRAIFFLKEMLIEKKNAKPNAKILPIFNSVLRLCFNQNNATRAFSIYKVMLEEKYLTLEPYANNIYNYKSVPLSFVQSFAPEGVSEQDVTEFWTKMNEVINVNFRKQQEDSTNKQPEQSYESIDIGDFYSAIKQSELHYQHIYHDTRYVTALDELTNGISYKELVSNIYGNSEETTELASLPKEVSNLLDPSFALTPTFHSPDPRIDSILQSASKTFVEQAAEMFDREVLSPNAQAPSDPLSLQNFPKDFFVGVSPMVKSAMKSEKNREFLRESFREYICTENAEQLSAVQEKLNTYLTNEFLKDKTKLHWIPVIIGLDGEPFYPKNVGMHLLTEETVKSAKDQYLNSIEDEKLREQVSTTMLDQVVLRFLDPSTNRLIQGLYY